MRVFKALRGARLTEGGAYITLAKSMRRLSRVAGGYPAFLCKDRLIHPATSSQSAKVAELVDALDLGSSAARRAGSSPAFRTIDFKEI
jgi:hypothetical protein